MAVKIHIRNATTGETDETAVKSLRQRYSGIPVRASRALPAYFYPAITNKIRGFFVTNFANREGWKQPNFKPNYAKKKDLWRRRGDSFNIGRIGLRPVIYGSENFGHLTDTIFSLIGTKNATTVSTSVKQVKGGLNIRHAVGLDSSLWDGGNQHYYIPSRGPNKGQAVQKGTTAVNQIEAFSHRVTYGRNASAGNPGNPSVFVRLTPAQKQQVKSYVRENFRRTVKNVIMGRA